MALFPTWVGDVVQRGQRTTLEEGESAFVGSGVTWGAKGCAAAELSGVVDGGDGGVAGVECRGEGLGVDEGGEKRKGGDEEKGC